jgi:glycosyltransferase involved in cell wall biosynthesis
MRGADLSIALVSRSDGLGGGASRIAEDLGGWLIAAGYQVTHYCADPVSRLKAFQAPLYRSRWRKRVIGRFNRYTRWLGFNEIVPFEFLWELRNRIKDVSVIHFHDLATAVSPFTLHLCAKIIPVVFTVHDCSAFTGGCMYPMGCERYLRTCGKCPQLQRMKTNVDFTAQRIDINRLVAKQKRIQFVFPSKWLRDVASNSLTFGRKPEVIANGFAGERYNFRNKLDARRAMGLAERQRIIIVAAHFLDEPRKGVSLAVAALRAIADLNPLVIFVGIPSPDLERRVEGVRFWQTGFVRNKETLGLLFSAADVFLCTSLEENLPIMIQEAMAAGTPVVSFGAGGIPEMVKDQRNGWLCAPGDEMGLARKLRDALSCSDLTRFGLAAQYAIHERFCIESFGARHVELYNRMALES